MFEYLSGFNVVDLFPSWSFLCEISGLRHGMERVHMEMNSVLNEIIEEHEGMKLDGDDTNEDLVNVLLRIKRSGEMDLSLTMENVKVVILDLFVAGSDSSSTTLVWAMIELIRHPKVMQKAQLERVMSFKFIREEEGNNLVEKIMIAKRSPMNLSEMLLSLSNVTIARAAFGKGSAQQKSFVGEISGLRHGMEQIHKEMDGVLNEIIEEHEEKKLDREDMNEDLVDVLLRIKRNGEMDLSLMTENVKAVILDLFLAGSETTSATIIWAMIELIRHPKDMQKAQLEDLFLAGTDTSSTTLVWAMTELIRHLIVMQKAQLEVRKAFNGKIRIEEGDIHELPYINQVIKETLGLHPPGPLLVPRLSSETVELAGYTRPFERQVVINVWAMMSDPEY
ncbi:hypothetical protein IEQ34_007170 [Dendrobium chrysotoxum]|uniref:Cytochrome P450 n=1 Tax=Dendrobium chrysotoxum TaxID=161865 RepID=A0AAV7GSC6_DENCH|nr:hypothetical protein IEQ34_007170 [Dendrobium chrysotoxum]